jgi:hypothetical protein
MADLDLGALIAEHDGYSRLSDPVVHRRAVVALGEDSILVADRMDAVELHSYSQRWPLHPALDIEALEGNRLVSRAADAGLALVAASTRPLVLRAVRGEVDPWAGWWSERLESFAPSWVVAAEVDAAGPADIVAVLAPFAESRAVEPELVVEPSERGIRTTITWDSSGVIEIDLDWMGPAVRRRMVTAA